MRFAHDLLRAPWVFFTTAAFALLVALTAALVVASLRRARAVRAFGDAERLAALETFDAAGRRAVKGVMLVVALLSTFVALARPQLGRGQRLIPATNLDVVLVLDFSKSMYARDVAPSRIARAKAEVGELVRALPGARFAAVAFAGEPMSFPLTSDGAAIAQFFRQLEPNDMPVGGTAIARALTRARDLLRHDERSKKHVRVLVLVTDGEDLVGDPVTVADEAAREGLRIHVVQIGGRAPEPIPDVGEDGRVRGIRTDGEGNPLTTELSAKGEAQLASIAERSGGMLVRAEQGTTGLAAVSSELLRMQREELSERVETLFDEAYMWPLAVAIALLVLEALVTEAPRRVLTVRVPPARRPRRGLAALRRRS